MELNIIESPTKKELFVREIENQILSGRITAGEKLPTEREMAEKMRVSRTMVNAGLTELEKKGFIQIIPRKGAVVADYLRSGNIDTLLAIINFSGGRLDYEIFNSMMEFRRNIECEGAFLAAEKRTEQDIVLLNNICEHIDRANTVKEMSELKFQYHHAILCATHNYIYPMVFNAFREVIVLFSANVFSRFGIERGREQTRQILSYIQVAAAEDAKEAMYKLISARMDDLKALYSTFEGTMKL